MDDNEFEKMMSERAAAKVMPKNLVASAHYRRGDEMLVRTGIFAAETPVVDIYRWASTIEGIMRDERPFRLLISAGE